MKRILVISPVPTHPQTAGNRSRIFRLLSYLKEAGHEVHFLYVNTEPGDTEAMSDCWGDGFHFAPYSFPERTLLRYLSRLRFIFEKRFTRIQPLDYRYDPSLDDVVSRLARRIRFDVVMVEYVFWSRALLHFDRSVLKIIDTHDVFANRHLMYYDSGHPYNWFCTTQKEEARGLDRADVVIAIQPREKEYFTQITKRKVITVGHMVHLCDTPQTDLSGNTLLFVGADTTINRVGVNHFITKVYPIIRRAVPEVELRIVGTICESLPDHLGCMKMGVVGNLMSLYKQVDVVINPILFSTGLSIKNMEAMGCGIPVVTTTFGAKGLEEVANRALLVADPPRDFAQRVIDVLSSRKTRERLSRAAYSFAKRFNEENAAQLTDLLQECNPQSK